MNDQRKFNEMVKTMEMKWKPIFKLTSIQIIRIYEGYENHQYFLNLRSYVEEKKYFKQILKEHFFIGFFFE